MATGPRYRVPFRRRREGKTDYRRRLKLLLSGRPRAVVRFTNRHVIAQIVEYSPRGDVTRVAAHSKELAKFGWKGGCSNLCAAYLVGYLLGKRAVEKGITEAVLDLGLRRPIAGGRPMAALRGIRDAGVHVPASEEVLPGMERIRGEHVARYAKLLGEEKQRRFSEYLKRGLDPEQLPEHFDEVLSRIRGA
ncbi:50S ribosomal protein L18 [Candidatus Pyrohabitans sp.]